MLILAHAVVPHDHHNKVFVAIVNILNHDAQDIFNHEHDHEHHHEGNSEITFITQLHHLKNVYILEHFVLKDIQFYSNHSANICTGPFSPLAIRPELAMEENVVSPSRPRRTFAL